MMAVERSFTSLGSRLIDLEEAGKDRLEDAEHLRAAGRYSSAIVMGVYALEIALKIRICRLLKLTQLPTAFEVHDLRGLLVVSGLVNAMAKRGSRSVKKNWELITITARDFAAMRYLPTSVKTRHEADDFFLQLNDPKRGVLPWISRQT